MIPKIIKDDTLDPAYFARKPRGGESQDLTEIIRRIEHLEACCEQVQPELETLRRAIEILNGDETVDGSIKQIVSDAVNEILDGAPEAFDTLKEVADWIAENTEVISNLEILIEQIEHQYGSITKAQIDALF